ncbi:hypothetical protein GCM10007160_16240 [Litchfieldella qijiaojingensis]|uniref:Uncharacterized protein n=1 Tax=Litchfieldella qijiaojingensis TaxID=980347 RepID=A0ABQ2YN45_9GAMM|nr:hypothetical protein [Halomonas qijiaojingensis]GGX89628.1 hypothetical protein GCM10007160_16240 [Halomonas qijiaojingensis]
MTQTVSAAYDNIDKAINAFDELVSDGFPRESLFLDKETNQVKVIVPDPVQREAEEILRRHEPERVWAQPFQPQ